MRWDGAVERDVKSIGNSPTVPLMFSLLLEYVYCNNGVSNVCSRVAPTMSNGTNFARNRCNTGLHSNDCGG